MSRTSSDNIEVYSKIIEYKRSIGVTQWTVLSIFVTASEAVFLYSLGQDDRLVGVLTRIFGSNDLLVSDFFCITDTEG